MLTALLVVVVLAASWRISDWVDPVVDAQHASQSVTDQWGGVGMLPRLQLIVTPFLN